MHTEKDIIDEYLSLLRSFNRLSRCSKRLSELAEASAGQRETGSDVSLGYLREHAEEVYSLIEWRTSVSSCNGSV